MYILNELAGNSFMVFCSTCANTQRVALMLRNLGMTAIPLHGQLSQVRYLVNFIIEYLLLCNQIIYYVKKIHRYMYIVLRAIFWAHKLHGNK